MSYYRNSNNLSGWEAVVVFVLAFILVIGLIAGFAALGAAILCWAWNAFVPPVFKGPEITFWQAFALTFLIGSVKGLFSINIKKKDS